MGAPSRGGRRREDQPRDFLRLRISGGGRPDRGDQEQKRAIADRGCEKWPLSQVMIGRSLAGGVPEPAESPSGSLAGFGTRGAVCSDSNMFTDLDPFQRCAVEVFFLESPPIV